MTGANHFHRATCAQSDLGQPVNIALFARNFNDSALFPVLKIIERIGIHFKPPDCN
jgi:hypothetical protein